MSSYDSTIALLANSYALKHVRREIRKARMLSFITRFHRRLIVLREHESILLAREPKLGKRKERP